MAFTTRSFLIGVLVPVVASLMLSDSVASAATSLFQSGAAESFAITETKTKKPPQIIVLNEDPMQISLAAIVGKALQFPADDNGLTLKLERFIFTPLNTARNLTAKPDKLNISARVSGREFELEPTISKTDFENGKIISVRFPEETNDASVATITSSGEMKFRYDSAADAIDILQGKGNVSYNSKLGLTGSRKLSFIGRGTHVKN